MKIHCSDSKMTKDQHRPGGVMTFTRQPVGTTNTCSRDVIATRTQQHKKKRSANSEDMLQVRAYCLRTYLLHDACMCMYCVHACIQTK